MAVSRRSADVPLRMGVIAMAGDQVMPTYIIERDVPGASKLSADQLQGIARKSNEVVAGLGVPYKWVTSYVAGDKLYCVHEAESAEVVHRHAREGGFPANKVTEVAAIIGPQTANGGGRKA
jgi:Nickel responsive protein SCO4226-like